MPGGPGTQVERRKTPRFTPPNVRASAVSDEFKKDFAKQLLNVGLHGACIETTGRLRPDVKLTFEARFEDLGATLRAPARIVWTDTVQMKTEEVHRAGLSFGRVETTQAVRDYLHGKNVASILERRREEYRDLKQQSDARKAGPQPRKKRRLAMAAALLLLLAVVYLGSFAALVWRGRTSPEGAAVTYRYASGGASEEWLAKLYTPAYWAARKAGLSLVYSGP